MIKHYQFILSELPIFAALINIQKSKKKKNMSIRKRMNVLFGTLLLTGSLFSQNVCVSTPETSLVLSAPVGGELKHVYYGDKLSEVDLQNINLTGTPDMPAYPVYGLNCPGESALAVK
ncbi:alpha-galactosidase, partial [Bacteroides cellulosilyticus]